MGVSNVFTKGSRMYDHAVYLAQDIERHSQAVDEWLKQFGKGVTGILARVLPGGFLRFDRVITRGPRAAEGHYWQVPPKDRELFDALILVGDLYLHLHNGVDFKLVQYTPTEWEVISATQGKTIRFRYCDDHSNQRH